MERRSRYIKEIAIRRLIKFKDNCCQSCHEDNELYGYDLSEINLGKDRIAECCCIVANAYDKWRKHGIKK